MVVLLIQGGVVDDIGIVCGRGHGMYKLNREGKKEEVVDGRAE